MLLRTSRLIAGCMVFLTIAIARGQETRPGVHAPGPPSTEPELTGLEKKYFDLSHSTDAHIKALAERYLFLTRMQEWGTASGKTVLAKYVSHEPDLSRVKLAVPRGTGKERSTKDYDVEVEKLSKVSQVRVKQIDALQKKLDELTSAAANHGTAPGGPSGPGAAPEGPGMERGREGRHAGRGAPPHTAEAPAQPQAPEPDPSASDPDPLGFAELPPVAAPGPGGVGPGTTGPGAASAPPNAGPAANKVDGNQQQR